MAISTGKMTCAQMERPSSAGKNQMTREEREEKNCQTEARKGENHNNTESDETN